MRELQTGPRFRFVVRYGHFLHDRVRSRPSAHEPAKLCGATRADSRGVRAPMMMASVTVLQGPWRRTDEEAPW